MTEWNDIHKAHALHVYCKSNGNIVACRDALKEQARQIGTDAPPLQTLKMWEREYKWGVWHLEVMHVLQADAAKAAIGDLRGSLEDFVKAKKRLMENILGVKNADDTWKITPAPVNGMETCINSLVRLVESEKKLRKELNINEGDENPMLGILGDAISGNSKS